MESADVEWIEERIKARHPDVAALGTDPRNTALSLRPAMTLIQATRTHYPSVEVETSIHDAAALMIATGCAWLPVVDVERRLLGLVTALDLLASSSAPAAGTGEVAVGDLMSAPPAVCPPQTTLEAMRDLMRKRREPIVLVAEQDGRLLGAVDVFAVLDAVTAPQSCEGPEPEEVKQVRGEPV
jgi:CBS domain-containing protein